MALGAELGHGLQQVAQPLHGHIRAGGGDQPTRNPAQAGPGREQVGVHPHRHHVQALHRHPVVAADVGPGGLRHRHHPVQAAGHPGLHPGEGVPAALAEPLPEGAGVGQLQAAVHGDGMMHGGQHRPAPAVQGQHPPAQALVVVDHVEVGPAGPQMAPGPQAEGQGLAEVAGGERGVLHRVGPVLPLPQPGLAHGVGLGPYVQAGQLGRLHRGVEDRVGRPAHHRHLVAVGGQGLGQVVDVDALAADVAVAPVGQQRHPQRGIVRGSVCGHGGQARWWGSDRTGGGAAVGVGAGSGGGGASVGMGVKASCWLFASAG